MSADKFDMNKLRESAGGIMGSIKSMINPGGNVPNVDPDDALGVKIAQITTLLKQMTDAQQEHVKDLAKTNELLNGAFKDIEMLRASIKAEKAAAPKVEVAKPVEKPAETPAEKPTEEK
ncbi:MAG: hypothetical protein NTU49_02340 [Gammaproteobacteria bacterium]|nr:hypothetical protein [Gammaproteobacteria bacterium]